MAYKQKKPTFFGSALKQYTATHGETGETKTFESKEEYHNFKHDDSGTGWTKQAKGLAAVELSQDNYNKSKTEGNLNILNRNIANLSAEDRKIYDRIKADESGEDVSPMKATPGYNMLMKGAGGKKFNKEGQRAGVGSNYYTSGDLSYRGEWNTDLITGGKKQKSSEDLTEKGGGGPDDGGGGGPDDGVDGGGSFKINWPKRRNKNNSSRQNDYVTTACPVFGEPGSENYRRGMAENKRNMSRSDWKKFKKQQRNKFDTPMW